jgi:DNA-binding transcriptional regulator YhcF (GntR family)
VLWGKARVSLGFLALPWTSPPLNQVIAQKLEARLSQDLQYQLPTISELAREHGVSLMTMWKAIRLLKEKGLIRAHQGRKIERTESSGAAARNGAASRLYSRIKQAVLDGTYRSGDPLPKLQYFAATLRISRLTILQALRELGRDGLIHKHGKRWIAGSQPHASALNAKSGAETAPVVLLVMLSDERLQNLFPNLYLAPFVNAFFDEMMKRGIQVQLAHRLSPVLDDFPIPCGQAGIRSIIRRLGDRYWGAVVIDDKLTEEDFAVWTQELSCFGAKPVVLFDPSEVSEPLMRKKAPGNGKIYRLYFDEEAAVRLAVRNLTEAGHRKIGYPLFQFPGFFWVRRRYEKLLAAAGSAVRFRI